MPEARTPGSGTRMGQGRAKNPQTSPEPSGAVQKDDLIAEVAELVAESGRTARSTVKIVQEATPRQHVIVWLVGAVLASLLPFVFLYFHGLDNDHPPGIYELLGRGDLLLISVVLTIGGITEVVLVLNKIDQGKMLSVALYLLGGVLAVVAEAAWYADITARLLDGQPAGAAKPVTSGSLLLFGLSVLCSTACVRVAAGAR